MPRPRRPWFRVYVEMFPDRKIRRLNPTHRWVWVALMGAARESPKAPALYVTEDLPMTVEEIADYADVKVRDVRAGLAVMQQLGMVTLADGVVSLPNFTHRQYESDDVTRRTRAHRERSNDTPKERSNDVPGNSPEAETDTETEPQTELATSGGGGSRNATHAGPPPTCPKHPDGPDHDEPCRTCRRVREWRDAAPARAQAHDLATRRARRQAIDSCPHCDDVGMAEGIDGRPFRCTHPKEHHA